MASHEKSVTRGDDPRFQRSRQALIEAMTALLDEAPLAEISITRVVERAQVTRPTFYRHFADVAEAARVSGLARLERAFPPPLDLEAIGNDAPGTLSAFVAGQAQPVLEHLRDRRAFYLRVLEGAATIGFYQELVAFLTTRMMRQALADAGDRDVTTVLAGGILWMVIGWLQEGGEDPPSMAQRLGQVAVMTLR